MRICNQDGKIISLFLIFINILHVTAHVLPSNTRKTFDASAGFVSVQRKQGERTVMVQLGGISAIERATGELASTDGLSADIRDEPSFIYREVTDGTEIAQVIYDGSYTPKNCFISVNGDVIQDLQSTVQEASPRTQMSSTRNHWTKNWKPHSLHTPPSVLSLSPYLQYVYNASDHTVVQYNDRPARLPPLIRTMISLDLIKAQCNKLLISGFPSSSATKPGGKRQRRGLLTYPKTLWCGKGTEATKYDELGEDVTTDKCCRAHDTCAYLQINPLDKKLFLRNIAPYTISDCKCDKM